MSFPTIGTSEERGIKKYWHAGENDGDGTTTDESRVEQGNDLKMKASRIVNQCYDIPVGMSFLRRVTWSRHVPISPTYGHDFPRVK